MSNFKKDIDIFGGILGGIGIAIQCIVISQLFYEYTGKLVGYVNSIEIVYGVE